MKIPSPDEYERARSQQELRNIESMKIEAAPFLGAVSVALRNGRRDGIKPIPNAGNVRGYVQKELHDAGWTVRYYNGLGTADLIPITHKDELKRHG